MAAAAASASAAGSASADEFVPGKRLEEEEAAPLADKLKFMDGPVASGEGFEKKLGFCTPPASYGGYGGSDLGDNAVARYTFEVPEDWKPQTVTKQMKGYSGIDNSWFNPADKSERAYVVSFLREGEDNKSFKINDPLRVLSGIASSNYDLQDAIEEAEDIDIVSRVDSDGNKRLDFDIDSTTYGRYLIELTVNEGRLYGIFVTSKSDKSFGGGSAPRFRRIFDSLVVLQADVLR